MNDEATTGGRRRVFARSEAGHHSVHQEPLTVWVTSHYVQIGWSSASNEGYPNFWALNVNRLLSDMHDECVDQIWLD